MPVIGSAASNPAVPPSWFNVKDYGAIGDNSADDATAIQNAINAVKAAVSPVTSNAAGHVLYFPAGFYKINSGLNLQGLEGITILGVSGRTQSNAGTCINYVGGGTGIAIDARGCQALIWDGVSVWCTAATFNGVLLSLDSLTNADTLGHRIQNCMFHGFSAGSSATMLSLAGNIEASIDNILFKAGGGQQVRCVNPSAPATWSNANSFRSCSFIGDRTCSIINPGPQTTLIDCTFEPTTGGLPAPIMYNALGNEPAELLSLVGCGFWDNTGTGSGSAWVKSTVATQAFSFTGTRFGICPSGVAISLSSHKGLFLGGCRFGSENGGTPNVFDPAYSITNGSMLGCVVDGGAIDNHAAKFV